MARESVCPSWYMQEDSVYVYSFQIGSLFSVVAVWYLFIQEKLILPLSSFPLHICLQYGTCATSCIADCAIHGMQTCIMVSHASLIM